MIYSILFVDDDTSILKSIKREFFTSDYNLYFAESGEDALKILRSNTIDIMITDIIMPIMDGYELLKKVKYLYPNVIRIALSGYTEQQLVITLVKSNLAKLYLNKPWADSELYDTIQHIINIHERLNNKTIKEFIESASSISTLPSIYAEINSALEDETSSIDDIINILNTDPVITSNILKIVNSAFYGLKTASLKTALIKLGFQNIKTIIITSSISATNSVFEELLWKHSNLTNKLTCQLYEIILGKKIPENYSLAGLLHDFGIILFLKLSEKEYQDTIIKKLNHPNLLLSYFEKEKFNFSHDELGAILLNYWELPSYIVEITLNHHNPERATSSTKEITYIVHLADYYSWYILDKNFLPSLKSETFDYLKKSKEEIEQILFYKNGRCKYEQN